MFSRTEGGVAGCIVVFAAFFIQVLSFGTSQSIGVYNIEFLRYFEVGAAAVSLVGSINLGVFLGAGPVASVLMSRWSHRQVALCGAVLTSVGLICMPFAPNIPYMYIFYGVITGLGNCLMYVPSHVLSGLYFNKHRSLATGIATAGSGLGATVFPIIIYNLIEFYGWRGSLFLLAGLNLHLFVFCALLVPVPKASLKSFEEENKRDSLSTNKDAKNGDTVHVRESLSSASEAEAEEKDELQHNDTEVTFSKDTYKEHAEEENMDSLSRNLDVKNGDTIGVRESLLSDCEAEKKDEHQHNDTEVVKTVDTIGVRESLLSDCEADKKDEHQHNDTEVVKTVDTIGVRESLLSDCEAEKKDEHQHNDTEVVKTVDTIGVRESLLSDCEAEKKNEHKHNDTEVTFSKYTYIGETAEEEHISIMSNGFGQNLESQRRQSVSQRLEKHFCAIFNFGFVIFFLSNIFWNAGGAIILIFLPEYMTSVGLSKEEASSVFTLIGAGTCIGCVLGGLLGNIKRINREFLYILGNVGAGVLTLLYPWPWLHTKLGQIILSLSFGLAFGIILGLLVVVTADLLGTEALGDGFGYLMLANGVGVFSGPPIAGLLMDSEGDLDPGMYLSGALTVMGGVVMCMVPICKKRAPQSAVEIELISPAGTCNLSQ